MTPSLILRIACIAGLALTSSACYISAKQYSDSTIRVVHRSHLPNVQKCAADSMGILRKRMDELVDQKQLSSPQFESGSHRFVVYAYWPTREAAQAVVKLYLRSGLREVKGNRDLVSVETRAEYYVFTANNSKRAEIVATMGRLSLRATVQRARRNFTECIRKYTR